MKILHVVVRLVEGGGILESILGLTRSLVSTDMRGCGILALTEAGHGPFEERCKAAGVRLHTATPVLRHTLWYSRDWIKQLEQIATEYDVVHIHGLWLYPLLATAAWCARKGVPFVVSPHGSLLPSALAQSSWKKRLIGPWVRRVYQRTACVHVTSEAEAVAVRRYWRAQVPTVACIPEGVEQRVGRQPDSPSTRIVTYMGRVSPEKNLEVLLEAWARLASEIKRGWRLRLIGFPPSRRSRYADAIGQKYSELTDVSFEAYCGVGEKWRVLSESDVFILPSKGESFGIVVVEALACGVPVITTKGAPWQELMGCSGRDLSAISRRSELGRGDEDSGISVISQGSVIRDGDTGLSSPKQLNMPNALNQFNSLVPAIGRCGWWVDVGVEPLAEALREAMGLTDEERHAMGENGRRLVEAKYTWPTIAAEMLQVYAKALNERTQSSRIKSSRPRVCGASLVS